MEILVDILNMNKKNKKYTILYLTLTNLTYFHINHGDQNVVFFNLKFEILHFAPKKYPTMPAERNTLSNVI